MRGASGSFRFLVALAVAASALAGVATPRPASAALRTFELLWTSAGAAAARGTLTLDDAVCLNPGRSTIVDGPAGCFVDLAFEISGASTGNGRFSLGDFTNAFFDTGAVTIDYGQEVIGQGPLDINFFGTAPAPIGVDPFLMNPAGAPGEDNLTLVSMTPLVLPFASDAQKCADAIAKASAAYFSARLKALEACRGALTKGTALFEDKAKTVPVQVAGACPDEYKAASKIAKARQKARGGLEKKCSDPVVAALPTCGETLDALADATGATGCLIESVDANVGDVLFEEIGL